MKIPRDLKPGDRLWYSKTEYATAKNWEGDLYREHPLRIMARTKGSHLMIYDCEFGHETWRETPPIIRVERIASKPAKKRAKVDNLRLPRSIVRAVRQWERARKENRTLYHGAVAIVCAIARRLEGGGK